MVVGIPDDISDETRPRPTRDDEYYFQDSVIFHVGNTLFRVPKSVFNVPGTIFEGMFALPAMVGTEPEGSSDDNPIVLNVDENDFRGFLRVIWGPRSRKLTDKDWLGALELATMWCFDGVRREAIHALDGWTKTQSLKQVILTAKKYHIVRWLKVAYTQLIRNQRALPFDELTNPPAVDWETVARLLHIVYQHATAGRYFNSTCNNCGSGRICCGVVDNTVEKAFKAEFDVSPFENFPS